MELSIQRPLQQTRAFLGQEPDFSEDVSKLRAFASDHARWIRIAAWLVGATALVLVGLLLSGRIDDAYRSIWSACC